MNIIFAGTPVFAQVALQAIHQAGFSIPLVLTQPDRPAGRGLHLQASPVKQYALAQGLAVQQPTSLKDPAMHAQLQEIGADVMVVAAYGLLLPAAVLTIPRLGCLNIHASLLPRWRGAAPIHRALEAGDPETGITIMQMDVGLDTGPILMKRALAIHPKETTGTLHDKLAALGAEMMVQALYKLRAEKLPAEPQPTVGITYAHKIEKAEARLHWQESATQLINRIRAYNPFPGAQVQYGDTLYKVWQATLFDADATAEPGTILSVLPEGIVVAAGQGALLLQELQKPGGKRQPANIFLQSVPLQAGERFV
ncbi:methionyl-tRNA formyltransferase [Parvibium lacunae]|uniref:Methionyl-tRNA formyltransferase n=1 Tax=Parvibium lacunae TaxID=1888893 RepID=A0A368L0A3_9BURK|nr:methionyl-tRNA formyltransferase [Parvibium lacunae]RCS56991.1 methionyl-tRNA formyltransferase [Parvibium lacunae]